MFRISAACLAVLLTLAGSPAGADDAARLKMARDLVDATRLADKMGLLLPRLEPSLRQALSLENVSKATGDAAVKRVLNPAPEDLQKLIDEMAALYAREFTEEDLSNILAFYRSPSGRDMLAKEADIGVAFGVLAQHWAVAMVDRTVADRAASAEPPASDRWRKEYIAAPDRAATLQTYIEPMDNPQWTALRTVTLANLIKDRCRDVRLNQHVLDEFLHQTGLDVATIGDLDMMKAVVAPAFSYFDTERLKLVCAASDDLFGAAGRLVPHLLSSGDGLPRGYGNGYLPVSPLTDVQHGKG